MSNYPSIPEGCLQNAAEYGQEAYRKRRAGAAVRSQHLLQQARDREVHPAERRVHVFSVIVGEVRVAVLEKVPAANGLDPVPGWHTRASAIFVDFYGSLWNFLGFRFSQVF